MMRPNHSTDASDDFVERPRFRRSREKSSPLMLKLRVEDVLKYDRQLIQQSQIQLISVRSD